ncbi:MAG: hypothetical protein JSS81_22480 [Acidobacteria bacterium]|nr:hypothetical protein [Acidobacteriota bacterium]
MKEIENKNLLILKGFLFLLLAALASLLLLGEAFSWKRLALFALAVWASCRFYYFMFYVIEKYVDEGYKFSGVASFVRFVLRKR